MEAIILKKALFIIIPIILALSVALAVVIIKISDDSSDNTRRKSSEKSNLKAHTLVVEVKNGGFALSDEDAQKIADGLTARLEKGSAKNIKITQDGKQFTIKFDFDKKSDFSESIDFDSLCAKNALTFREGMEQNGNIILTNEDISKAYASIEPDTALNIVSLEFTEEGKEKFAEATRRLIGSQISIWMDEYCICAPFVRTAIDEGTCYIDGMEDTEDAEQLAERILSVPIPFPVVLISSD